MFTPNSSVAAMAAAGSLHYITDNLPQINCLLSNTLPLFIISGPKLRLPDSEVDEQEFLDLEMVYGFGPLTPPVFSE